MVEVGTFNPGYEPCDELYPGDVGYICRLHQGCGATPGWATPSPTRTARRTQPLPGYRKVTPMVFCGIYPADGADYDNLKDALEKLRMNDASLSFDPETSVALGYGFRCGFLGLLHMEIIQQRLEREFDLDLVTTAPSVIYHVYKTDGSMVEIDNPSNLPPIGEIEHMEEPYVTADHLYAAGVCGRDDGHVPWTSGASFIDMQYEGGRVKLIYEIPLNEIIYEFFDQVKSRSRGYASFDYELHGYRESDLVKLDILLNGEICDAFSIIVHRDKAYARGRSIAEKLKDVIPRQLFEIPIQAAIGGKVIARETVQRHAQGRSGQVLRRRHHPQEEAAGKAEGRQEAHAPVRHRRSSQRSLPRRPQNERRLAGTEPLHPGLRATGAQGSRGTWGLAGVLPPWHDECHGSPVWCGFLVS